MTAPPVDPPSEPAAELDEDPDVRFSYANERTFLAWNRTALAMVTAGLAITQLLPPFDVPGGRRMIGIPLILAGTIVSVASFVQWRRNEEAMRRGEPLPSSILPALVAIVVGLSAMVALVLALFDSGSGVVNPDGHPTPPDRTSHHDPVHHPAPGATYERDKGLAAERTELAWGRSTLALLACGAAVAKGLPQVTGTRSHPVAGALLLGFGGLVWLLGLPYARARAKASHTGERHRATAVELAPLAFGTAAVGVAALVIDLFLPR